MGAPGSPDTMLRRLLFIGSLLVALALEAAAQSVTFLEADAYERNTGQRLAVRFDRWGDEGAVPAPWPEAFEWFLVRVSGRQENLQASGPVPARDGELGLVLSEPGITLLGADRAPWVELVPSDALRAFLASRVGPATLPGGGSGLPERDVRVRRLESSKLLMRALGESGWLPSSATAQSKTGQRGEIRPLGDPTSVRPGSDLPFRIYLPGPKEGVVVLATHVASGRVVTFSTGAEGTGYFTVSAPGVWVVEAHHARPLAGDPEADWEIASATLTFEVPAWDPREGDER